MIILVQKISLKKQPINKKIIDEIFEKKKQEKDKKLLHKMQI